MSFSTQQASCDARGLHTGSYSSWLMKVKGDGARARWMSNASKRYFTIDYDSELFYYSHTDDRKKISNPIRFKEILDATQLPRPSQAPFKGLTSKKKDKEFAFGFVVQTAGRAYELYTETYLDAMHWVGGLIAGRDIANGVPKEQPRQLGNTYLGSSFTTPIQNSTSESSQSTVSTTADGGSDSGRSSEQDVSRQNGLTTISVTGPPRPQPRTDTFSGGYGAKAPPVASNYGAPLSGGSAWSGGYGGHGVGNMQNAPPISQSTPPQVSSSGLHFFPPPTVPAQTHTQSPEVSMMPPTGSGQEVDPFAALDALEELAGPLEAQTSFSTEFAPRRHQNIQGALLREACSIVTNKSKPSAQANETLQRLKSNPVADDSQSGSYERQLEQQQSLSPPLQRFTKLSPTFAEGEQQPLHHQPLHEALQQQPLAPLSRPVQAFTESPATFAHLQHQPSQQQPLAPLAPPVQAFTESPASFAQVQHQPLQQQPLQYQAPQQQPLQHQPLQQSVQQQAVQQQQSVAAMTNHNPSAESWDSDEDEPPNASVVESVTPVPLAPARLQQLPTTKTPPIVNGWTAPATSHVANAPPMKQVDPLASGWDSDDDNVPVKQQAAPPPLRHQQPAPPLHHRQPAPPPLHHQQATSAVDGLSDNDWDDDDTAPFKAPEKAKRVKPKSLVRDPCGAPMQPTEAFVTASKPPAKVVAKQKLSSDDDLDDLVGEVLAASTTSSSTRKNSSHGLVPDFHCTGCDFQVLRIDDCIWGSGVEYMFFRNNYPNVQKMRPQLVQRKDCCAYCCQCSWKSAEIAAPLEDVAAGLRWRKIA